MQAAHFSMERGASKVSGAGRGYHSSMGVFMRIRAVAAKEFWSLLRQPQLLLLLLVGPVLIMVAFALSFELKNIKPRAVVVVEAGSEGEEIFEQFKRQFTERTRFQGVMRSVEAADERLRRDETDAVIILPPEPSESVGRGRQAVLEVHYNTINPIFGTTVPNRSNGLILDLNREIVREGVARELESVRTAQEDISEFNRQLEQVNRAAESLTSPEARATTGELENTLEGLEKTLKTLKEADSDNEDISGALEQTRKTLELLRTFREVQEEGADAIKARTGITDLERELADLSERAARVPSDVPPSVLVNPFRLELRNLAPFQPEAVGFYAPATLALLIQHIAVSLGSLAVVRERLSGAYEFFEISPLGPGELLAGKFLTYAALVFGVNMAVAGVLASALKIPIQGGLLKLAAAMLLLTAASLAVGFLLSVLSRTQLQAIQIAMLTFIASGFFAGFLFPLEELTQPAQSISYFLPATYGIRALQDVMIRGEWPARMDLVGFAVIFFACLVAARVLMARKV